MLIQICKTLSQILRHDCIRRSIFQNPTSDSKSDAQHLCPRFRFVNARLPSLKSASKPYLPNYESELPIVKSGSKPDVPTHKSESKSDLPNSNSECPSAKVTLKDLLCWTNTLLFEKSRVFICKLLFLTTALLDRNTVCLPKNNCSEILLL